VKRTSDGAWRAGLRSVALDRRLWGLIRSWNPIEGLVPLLSALEEDSVAAALWEVLWRFEPSLNDRLGFRPPFHSPNPFLVGRDRREFVEWPSLVADRDLDAARLLAAAIRIEGDQDWPDAERIAGRHRFEWSQLRETELRSGFPGWESALSVEVPESPTARAEHVQQMFTRLLLLGDPSATKTVLAAHADLLREDLYHTEPSEQEEFILDAFVPPVNLALDRLAGFPPRAYVPSFLRNVATVRSAVSTSGGRFVLGRLRRRLLVALAAGLLQQRRKLGPRQQPVGV